MAEVTLPSLGESVTEGIITRWFKKVGDTVARDEPLFEVSTDKVDSEMPSPAAGVLVEILAHEGDTVETGARVAVIDENATAGVAEPTSAPSPSAEPPVTTAPSPTPSLTPLLSGENGIILSPVVRRILADAEIDPATVTGTGPAGQITRRDAERAVATGPADEVIVPLSPGRLRMAAHMSVTAQTTPHGFVAVDVDASTLSQLATEAGLSRDGLPISEEAVVALCAVRALADFPLLNASFAEDHIVRFRTVSLGVQRSVEPDGMLVPVVHAAGDLSLRALVRRLADLDERVASRHLTSDDLLGGTFTVAAAQTPHTLFSTAFVIQPQAAVLTMGASRTVPVFQGTSVTKGRQIVLGLSFDHRVVDPVMAAQFLERVSELLTGLDLESER